MTPLEWAQSLTHELISLRRDFHRHPETGFEVARTAEICARHLESSGIDVKRNVGKSGVLGILEVNRPTGAIAFRAELDALDMDEETDLEFKSVNPGKAHACGHDAHMAMLLGAARILAQKKDGLEKNVRFLFQPSEEKLPGGARAMIEEGVLDGVDECFAIHLTPRYETGKFGTRSGPILAAPDNFSVRIIGRGGHAGVPQLCVDPVVVGAELIQAIQTVVSRKSDPLQSVVVSVCMVHAGTANNVIPESLTLGGTVRTLSREIREGISARLEEMVRGITQAHGARYEFHYEKGYPVTVNDSDCAEKASTAILELFGEQALVRGSSPLMAGDDIAYMLEKVKGSLVFMGCRREGEPMIPNHHPAFTIDEACLPLGAALFCKLTGLR